MRFKRVFLSYFCSLGFLMQLFRLKEYELSIFVFIDFRFPAYWRKISRSIRVFYSLNRKPINSVITLRWSCRKLFAAFNQRVIKLFPVFVFMSHILSNLINSRHHVTIVEFWTRPWNFRIIKLSSHWLVLGVNSVLDFIVLPVRYDWFEYLFDLFRVLVSML